MRCADNWAKNAYRQRDRRQRREASWPQVADADAASLEWEPVGTESEPTVVVMRAEVMTRILRASRQLTPAQRELFARYFLLEQTAIQVAALGQRSPNTVRQAVWALRRRLRRLLEQEGLDEEEAQDYLSGIAETHFTGLP